jgi:hypothetical protein
MNPLEWKREHQITLICAVALGGLIGAILGLFYLSPNRHFEICDVGHSYGFCLVLYLPIRWIVWGALIGGAVGYIRQLLRA